MPLTRRLTQVTQVRESLPDDEAKVWILWHPVAVASTRLRILKSEDRYCSLKKNTAESGEGSEVASAGRSDLDLCW